VICTSKRHSSAELSMWTSPAALRRKKGTEHRLHHVRAVEPGRQPAAQMLLGQSGQALGVPRKELLRRLGVAASQT